MNKDFDILSDDFFGAIMDVEDKKHFAEISANIVPLEMAKPYDYVQFGKVIWQVIGVEKGKKLLLSKEITKIDFDYEFSDDLSGNSTKIDIDDVEALDYCWETGEVRKYFNEWFCDHYLSAEERQRIDPHIIKIYDKNSIIKTLNDPVFLLNSQEVEKYLPIKDQRISTMHVMFNDVPRAWLLRSDNSLAENYEVVNTSGEIEKLPPDYVNEWFRPAVWVK